MQHRWLLLLGIVLILVAVGGFVFTRFLSTPKGGLDIETNPPSTVFLDGQQAGRTPYKGSHSVGEIVLRLVPNTKSKPLSPWEAKIRLARNIETVVRYDFGETPQTSSGYILSFEKIQGDQSEIAIISQPDSAEVVVDGETYGFTPLSIATTPGEHKISLSYPGHIEREIDKIRTRKGYRLTVEVALAEDKNFLENEATSSAQPQINQSLVEVLDTPTGFLRVRADSTTSSKEIGRIKPGERFLFLGENQDGSWYKIEYEDGKEGWVSARYAKKTTGVINNP